MALGDLREIVGLIGAASGALAAVWAALLRIFGRRNATEDAMRRLQLIQRRIDVRQRLKDPNTSEEDKEDLERQLGIVQSLIANDARNGPRSRVSRFADFGLALIFLFVLPGSISILFILGGTNPKFGFTMAGLSLVPSLLLAWWLTGRVKSGLLRPLIAFIMGILLLVISFISSVYLVLGL